MDRPHCLKPDSCDAKGARKGQVHCRLCANTARNRSPEMREASRVNMKAKCADPAFREAGLKARPKRSARIRLALATPEGLAEFRRRQAAGRAKSILVRTKAHWPQEQRERYFHLTRVKHVPAAEAEKILLPEIPGTVEHAKRQVANSLTAQRIRSAREKAQEY